MSGPDLSNYVEVAERIREFRREFPEGSLQPVQPTEPYKIETIGERHFIVYTAAAFRTPEDPTPGIGTAWEPFPGKTSFTKDSELMNAETSAWGRAIVAALAADTQRIASAEEVRNRAAANDGNSQPTAAASASSSDGYVFKFGKHKGKALADVPADYLEWLLDQPARAGYERQHEEQHAIFRRELEERSAARDLAQTLQVAGEHLADDDDGVPFG